MKFSHSLLFSTVPEWQSYYVSYDSLKATIYKIEKDQASSHQSSLRLSSQPSSHPSQREPAQSDSSNNELQDHENNESTGLLQNHDGSPEQATSIIELQPNPLNLTPSDRIFLELLSQELAKVEEFYQSKQQELFDELNGLINEIETIEKQGMQLIQDSFNQSARSTDEAIDDEDDDEDDEEEEDNGRGEEGTSNQPRPAEGTPSLLIHNVDYLYLLLSYYYH
ncbi:low-affinity phosphate transporter [Puccinia graminis f. sp. tritici]|uniref:Low-affinity phosphate transporter n=1 Tax=Puccinia graminis f. sp. tritici TaxID=56615 RepID=A0A5B0S8F7_PUCGR|nr:low-affinity phosphate transporter [Puccinia graminis f. sp. tritici]